MRQVWKRLMIGCWRGQWQPHAKLSHRFAFPDFFWVPSAQVRGVRNSVHPTRLNIQPRAFRILIITRTNLGWEQVCAKDQVKALIFDDMMACAKGSKLRGFEIPKAIHLVSDVNALGQGFSVDNDLLTPTVRVPFHLLSRIISKGLPRSLKLKCRGKSGGLGHGAEFDLI
jgi:hypothetical protein